MLVIIFVFCFQKPVLENKNKKWFYYVSKIKNKSEHFLCLLTFFFFFFFWGRMEKKGLILDYYLSDESIYIVS